MYMCYTSYVIGQCVVATVVDIARFLKSCIFAGIMKLFLHYVSQCLFSLLGIQRLPKTQHTVTL